MKLPLFDLAPQAQRTWLAERLSRPAPASARNLSDGYRLPGREGEPTPAAVLVPVRNRPDGLGGLFSERSAHLPDHAGQISFPGGRVGPGGLDIDSAGLREAPGGIGPAPGR